MKRKKPDYNRKAKVIEMGIPQEISKFDRMIYLNQKEGNIEGNLGLSKLLADKIEEWGFDNWVEGRRVNAASFARKRRLRSYIAAMLLQSEDVVFLTFTFNEEVMHETSFDTRHRYVQRYLKEQAAYYIANIDFGEENGREHYHAIAIGHFDYSVWHKYGAIKGIKCHRSLDDADRLSKYVDKLTNHAVKETTGAVRVIYSRNMKALVNGLADGSIALYQSPLKDPLNNP